MSIFEIQGWIYLALAVVLLAVKVFAFISAATFSADSYEAAGKLTKPAWLLILGLAVVLQLVGGGFFLLSLVFTIAALVYLADVRPALEGLRRR